MSFMSPSAPNPPPLPAIGQAPASPPAFGAALNPGQKPQRKPSQPTFLGAQLSASAPNLGQKTLLGT